MGHKAELKLIHKYLKDIKDDKTTIDMFKKYDVDIDELFLIPICFKDDLDVSARTEHAVIYLNRKLLKNPDQISHYLIHEICHVLQQTTSDGPIKGSTEDNYLDNPAEIEGFNNQTKHISETESPENAEIYIEKVLDHHSIDSEKERKERKDELLQLASSRPGKSEQLKLDFHSKKEQKLNKTQEELLQEFEKSIDDGPKESHARPTLVKLHPNDQTFRMRQLKELLEKIKN
jgi:hypothetical protein